MKIEGGPTESEEDESSEIHRCIKATTSSHSRNPSEHPSIHPSLFEILQNLLRSNHLDIIARLTSAMPRNRLPPTANPPEEESESESEEDESDPEEEVEEEEKQVVAEGEGNRKEVESDEDSEEEEEGEDPSEKTTSQLRGLDYGSDGDSGQTFPSPSVSAFVVKPNLKPEKKKEKEKKKKRVAESDLVKEKVEVKKAKKEKKGNGVVAVEDVIVEDKAKRSSGGSRIWGPEDELMILKGMMDYKEKTGVDFNSNLDAFYNFIKGSLNAVVDKSQLVNKIRTLKEKYRDNASKEANGEAPVFIKSHEAEAYELSKKIYEGDKAVSKGSSQGVKIKSKPKSKVEVNVVPNAPSVEMDNVLALPVPEVEVSKKEVIGGSAKVASRVRKVVPKMDLEEADVEMKDYTIPMPVIVDDFVVKKGLELAEKSKVDALNDKWTKYQLDAAELYVKRLDLVMEHTKLILDALKSNP